MSQDKQKGRYIVIRLTTGEGPCKIIRDDELYAAIYSQVYGPASRGECEKWVAKNC